MAFLRRHRVLVVLLGLGVLVSVLVGYRIKKQQAAALPRRQLEIVVGVTKARAALVAAEAQLSAARSQIETQKSQVALARTNIERERASLKIAQTNLDNTRITAPFAGHVSARNLYPGAAVSSQAAGTSNSSVGILVLQDLSVVKVQIEVQERDISRVRSGSVARVLVDAYRARDGSGFGRSS